MIKHAWDVYLRIRVYGEEREDALEAAERLLDKVAEWSVISVNSTRDLQR